ncbi:hypothetical protein ACFWP2_27415 [Kitasatospora sp. NPDC058444]|uniref:DUF7848 domain-containing protein n=1 Tax=Kitasatospora sp. NPDC058444 TaxID=3346504 RepID=UPI003650C07D
MTRNQIILSGEIDGAKRALDTPLGDAPAVAAVVLSPLFTVRVDESAQITPPEYVLVCVAEDEKGVRCGATSHVMGRVEAFNAWVTEHVAATSPDHMSYRLQADLPMEAMPVMVSPSAKSP